MNVFGRVGRAAKGVGGALLNELKAASVARDQGLDAEIESLLHRISEGHRAEDRREAVASLKDTLQGSEPAQVC